MPELKYESGLNEMPVLMGLVAGGRFWEDVLRNNDLPQRARIARALSQIEPVSYRHMEVADRAVFLYNATRLAILSWNRQAGVLGWIYNRLTVEHLGYVRVPGAVLTFLLERAGHVPGDAEDGIAYLLRVDVAAEHCEAMTPLLEGIG